MSTTATPIADALILTFTAGVSLREWRDSGGLEREWALYRRLVPGHYPRMIAVTHGQADDHDIAREAQLGAAVTVICNDHALERAAYEASVPARVREHIESLNARSTVVKTNQFKGGGLAIAITRELRAAGVRTGLLARAGYHWSRHVARDEGHASLIAAEASSLEGELCRAADAIAVTTGAIADDVAWRHALPAERIRVVPNYVIDEAANAPGSSPGAPGRERGTVLIAGRLHPRKRVDLAIRAAASCASVRRLVIAGDGPERSSLERLTRELGVSATFTGRVPHHELLSLMARCDLFLQCALFEGHPKTVLEAMGAGAAVVVADTPGLGDVIRDGRTGLRVPLDPSEPLDRSTVRFAETIESLLTDDALRARLGRAARDHVQTTLTLSAVLPIELDAHRAAFAAARAGEASPMPGASILPPVRWDPALLTATPDAAIVAFERGIHGYIKRLPIRNRCEFLFGLDWPLYQMQGMAAGELEGGLHPKHRLLRYHDFFVARVSAGERVIDLGCGNGALMCSIASRAGHGKGARVTGIELNETTAAKARARAHDAGLADRITVHQGDITTLRAPGDDPFDTLVLSNVLEHIDRRPERLAMWREWYRPRRWLIRVPAFDREWRAPFKKELGVEWRLDVTHETEYTRDQLERELAQAGLAIDELIVNWGEYWCSARPIAGPSSREDTR